ncbi:MAG: hypothetical protein KIT73_18060 [Burkholderiales bacterium]|nr:hypothetical protein [Burkholderiales bacterium]
MNYEYRMALYTRPHRNVQRRSHRQPARRRPVQWGPLVGVALLLGSATLSIGIFGWIWSAL